MPQKTLLSLVQSSRKNIIRYIRALIDGGYLRWTDPHRTIEQYGDDEPLAIELTEAGGKRASA